ncbi:hypothetical protein LTR37_010626 [Vermiconidia calcicola]|uniref:Uncharacterized protein n=1 Tax=Vermiconidia calcicola TaxID=1690605 RepID=A0ACC3N5G4_9PEZI|nr:hypothetical protein LTR37_010626 [Vermiconidia calcicola]
MASILVLAALIFAVICSATTTATAHDSCTLLGHILPRNQVLFPSDESYKTVNDRWSLTAKLEPSCVVLPTSAQDVSSALKVLVTRSTLFAVKSKGHNAITGFNNINGGVTIDLSWINETTLAKDRSLVRLGSGAAWVDAYRKLNSQGVSFPGGRCSTTGVGGLTLGGGISFYSAKVGFVADNVLNFEVVLASGKIVNANMDHNSDLFMALKGGSSNFGIVTRFEVKAFKDYGRIFGGGVFSKATTDTTSQSLNGVYNFVKQNHKDEDAALATIFNYNATGKYILNSMVYTKPVAIPAIFKAQFSIPHIANDMRIRTMADMTEQVTTFLPWGYRDLFATATIVNKMSVIEAAHRISDQIYEEVQHVPDLVWNFYFEPLPRLFTDHSEQLGGNIMGLNRTQEDLIVMMLNPRWRDAEYDAEMADAAEAWVDSIRQSANRLSGSNDFQFLNYAAKFQRPLESYGPPNLDFMRHVSFKYDPHEIFQNLMPGAYKISR